jgi:cytochrome c oxidase assembly protein subunit 15
MLLISYQEPRPGFIIEHTHRLAGYVVGCCVIVLAAGLWRYHARRLLGWLGITALAAVVVQGLLGGFRVKLNALVGTDLALIHGLFAQLVFALLVSLALLTSRTWRSLRATPPANGTNRVWKLSLATTLLIFAQMIFGAILRHTDSPLGPRGHILLALAVVAVGAWLVRAVFEHGPERSLTVSVTLLATLVAVQVGLGVEALLIRLSPLGLLDLHVATFSEAIIRTGHFVLGSLIFATAVAVSCQAYVNPTRQRGIASSLARASGSEKHLSPTRERGIAPLSPTRQRGIAPLSPTRQRGIAPLEGDA